MTPCPAPSPTPSRLNEVRPRWPEQSAEARQRADVAGTVSMESGLEGRNNWYANEDYSDGEIWSQ